MPTRSLPARPSLDQLKLQANEMHRGHRDRDPSAAARIVAHHPQFGTLTPEEALDRRLTLADAQLVIAREYGYTTWADLKRHVETIARLHEVVPHPKFEDALDALDTGDIDRLDRLLTEHPELVHARTRLDPPYDYFTGATLLHHLAGNPDREIPLPRNAIAIARLLLDRGADVHARTMGANGGDVMGLLITSRRANDQGVTGALMDLLLERGAHLDLQSGNGLHLALANHAPRAAEKMIQLGARPDVVAAAALGRIDLLEAEFDDDGRLVSRPRRDGHELSERDAIGLAMLFAYVRGERAATELLLEKDGNWNVTGVGNGTALHRAAGAGDLDMVRRLIERGADPTVRDATFGATPLAWAGHGQQRGVFEWMRANCPIDLHDAVCFGFREHVEARLREEASSVNGRRNQWDVPLATPLHCAALTGRHEMAALLLEHGADPAILAGNGVTPLDIAEYQGAREVVRLLEQHGAPRSVEAARLSRDPALRPFEKVARDVLEACRSGAESALANLQAFFRTSLIAADVRRFVRMRLQRGRTSGAEGATDITIAEARDAVAGARGFPSWAQLVKNVARGTTWGRPLYAMDAAKNRLEIRRAPDRDEWSTILQVMADRHLVSIDAGGHMTDEAIAAIAELPHVTALQLAGSRNLTDAGLPHLARLPGLSALNVSGCSLTDKGLAVLRQLPVLRRFELHWQRGVSDEGVAHLASCEALEHVDVLGSPFGDGLIAAVADKPHLRYLKTGTRVTDAALPLLHRIPRFKAWSGERATVSLMSAEADPVHLMLDGPVTDAGLFALHGLEGLLGLAFFWHSQALTPAGLRALGGLQNLEFLGWEGERCTDEAMRHIAALPRLRMLQAQGAVATDSGFSALSESASLEYLWGRECRFLSGPGFAALARLPSLRGLGVSCKRVDDDALAQLAGVATLRELMPMDVSDAGFRYVGGCANLESLWCMYCRDTTDAATEQIGQLTNLRRYYAGQTRITNRSLDLLARLVSLEWLEFWNCEGISDEGAAFLARLPQLREVIFDNCRNVTQQVVEMFPPSVRVRHTV